MEDELEIYRYNDEISFRKCSLFEKHKLHFGDCTSFYEESNYYSCNQYGIHFHCTNHKNVELKNLRDNIGGFYLKCPICNNMIIIDDLKMLISDCLKLLNNEKFKNAKLIRLDDYYVKEVKLPKQKISDYWIKADVKMDKDGDTIVVVYVGKNDYDDKAQFFIKPEKLQLSTDYKNLDPAKVLTKIEVTLKDRIIKQEYNNK